ncbi:MAG TPA: haloacid dehalogenase [Micromonosporaceae bacterium]|nr:haloacid dehalogenase [Micromonosporaceae bacterium]HCU49113.1 haloacid dehalogenase [Micromonosporaceae bacterium]
MTIDPIAWVTAAAADCGVALDHGRATVLADRIATAGGFPGVAKPSRIPPQLAESWADRDLYAHASRHAYIGLAATVPCDIPGLAEAIYERILTAQCWQPYPDALPTLSALYAAGIKVAVVSNISFDIRPLLQGWGLSGLCDAVVLSFEVGCIKPDPKIFLRACAQLGVEPERTLMVGDTPADAGAAAIGCSALILAAAPPGRANGLHRAYRLAQPDR